MTDNTTPATNRLPTPPCKDYTGVMIRIPARTLSSREAHDVLTAKSDWILACTRHADALPLRIIAFGSAARDQLREDSDIDLALLFRTHDELRRAKAAVYAAPRPDLWPLDLLFYTTDEFHERAARGGVCMLIRNEGHTLFSAVEEQA